MDNNTVFEYDATYPSVAPEVPCEAPVPVEESAPATEQSAPQKKNGASRLFAFLFTLVAIACAILPCTAVADNGLAIGAFYSIVLATVTGGNKIFGIIPTLADTSTALGQFAGLTVYVAALCVVLAVVCGIVAVFSKKNAPCRLRATLFFLTFGTSALCVSSFLFGYQINAEKWMELILLNVYSLAIAVVGFIALFVSACAKVGKKAWCNLLQTVLAFVAVSAIAFFTSANEAAFATLFKSFGLAAMVDVLTLVVYVVAMLGAALALLRLTSRKNNAWDLIRYIVVLLVAGVSVYAAFVATVEQTMLIVAIVAAAAALLNFIGWFFKGGKKCKKEKKVKEKKAKAAKEKKAKPAKAEKAVEATVVEPVAPQDEYIREEYAEALPYQGGPVEGVEVAEEVNPTYVAPPPEVQTAGYDFYNCKSFDPFIAILNQEERNQFTELFILKYKGVMPELPDYVVGGDNKNFFRKLFIYLGQYRDRIPDGLLTKIYQFAVRM